MFIETLLGIAIVLAVIGVIVLVRAALPKRFVCPGVRRVTVFRCDGDAVGLEGAMREAAGSGEMYILDAGMSGEALRRARILARRYGAYMAGEIKFTKDTGSTDGRD